jgi:hypothetical protein
MLTFSLNTLLPYRHIELLSPLSVHEIEAILSDAAEPRRRFRFSSAERIFEGIVTDHSFRLQRIISYRNSFLPQIRGKYAPHKVGCQVSITMRLHWVVFVFITVSLSGLGAATIFDCVAAFKYGSKADALWIPLGMLLFVFILVVGGFSFEATKAERILTKLTCGTHMATATRNKT